MVVSLEIVHQNELSLHHRAQHQKEFKLEVEKMQRKNRKVIRTNPRSEAAKELDSNNDHLVQS